MAVQPKHVVWYYIVYSKDEISCEQRQLTCDFVIQTSSNMQNLKGPQDGTKHSELLDFWDLYSIRNSKYLIENTTFQKLEPFPSSGERDTTTQLGNLERGNLVM
jgi:hypothetical protein